MVGDLEYLTIDVDRGYSRKVLAHNVGLLDADCQPKFIAGMGELADQLLPSSVCEVRAASSANSISLMRTV